MRDEAKNGRAIILFEEILKKLGSTASADLFVASMRKMGLLLSLKERGHIPDDELIVNPQWLIDAFKEVINHNKSDRNNGKIKRNSLEMYWKTKRYEVEGFDVVNTLLTFMESLGLVAQPSMDPAVDYFVIPSLLPILEDGQRKREIEKWLWDEKHHKFTTLTLDMSHNGKQVVPFPHFDQIMAEVIAKPPIDEKSHLQHEPSILRNGCVVRITGDKKLGYFLCHGYSIFRITMFTEATESIGIPQVGNECAKLVSRVIKISKKIETRFNQYFQEKPTIGLSCDPFPNDSYLPMDKAQSGIDDSCCKIPECKRISTKDIYEFKGKYWCLTRT